MFDLLNLTPDKIKELNKKELIELSSEIREFLIEKISKNGGHLSSNLGIVEITIALHYVFDSPNDKFIFDVGHQSYVHKILTGRGKYFDSLRKYDGLSGFIKKSESVHDIWESGHSSTSISAQTGFLLADDTNKVISIIGDASISNGVAYEALNYLGSIAKAPIIILNDNKMAISPSVGAASRSLSKLRSSRTYQSFNSTMAKITPRFLKSFFHRVKHSIKGLILKENIFEDMGFDYMGPYNGNDIMTCIKVLSAAKKLNKPCVIHFVTQKGKGYSFAENDIDGIYHGIGPFDKDTGEVVNIENGVSFSKVASHHFAKLISEKNYYIITPAMMSGTHLSPLKKSFPNNIIDVGIAEEHAAVMASAMSQSGKNVILSLYSTFAQRSYDFLLNDIARSNVNMIIAIDRAGFVPGDGETHQGIYDIAMFSSMPNVSILSPKDGPELCALFDYASNNKGVFVIRYEKRNVDDSFEYYEDIKNVSWVKESVGDVVVITYGEGVSYVKDLMQTLDIKIELINARFIKPMDYKMLDSLFDSKKDILVYETCIENGSLGQQIILYAYKKGHKGRIETMTINNDCLVPCGDVESLKKHTKLSSEDIKNYLIKLNKNQK